ncbi:MAG: YdcF family protein [Bacteroidota bacterium]
MDFILSKLLPQLVYPLGLACVLLAVALWRTRRTAGAKAAGKPKGRVALALALLALLLGGNRFVAYGLTDALEDQAVALRADSLAADAVVVLGGGTRPLTAPRMTAEVNEGGDRVLYAAQLWRAGAAPLVVVSGGSGSLGAQGAQPEAYSMAGLMRFVGVPDSALVLEPRSRNTYENAVETKRLLDARGVTDIVLVTSAFHMPRAVRVFEAQGFSVRAAPTDFIVTDAEWARVKRLRLDVLLQNLLPDAEMLQLTTRAMKEYIGTAVYRLRGWL